MCYFGKFTSLRTVRTHFPSTSCMIRDVIYICSTYNVGRVLCESLLFIVTGCFDPQGKYGKMIKLILDSTHHYLLNTVIITVIWK